MQRCPNCNARLTDDPNCPRCKADLGLIRQAEQVAVYWRQKALQYFFQEEKALCLDALERSLSYKQSDEVLQFKHFVRDRRPSLRDELRNLCLETWVKTRPVLSRMKCELQKELEAFLVRYPPAKTAKKMQESLLKKLKKS